MTNNVVVIQQKGKGNTPSPNPVNIVKQHSIDNKTSLFSRLQLSPLARQRLYKFLIGVLLISLIVGIILLIIYTPWKSDSSSTPTPTPTTSLLSTGDSTSSSNQDNNNTTSSSGGNTMNTSTLCTPSSEWNFPVNYTTISEDVSSNEMIPLKMFVVPNSSTATGIVGMFTITKPVRTFQIHIYLNNMQLSNNGQMLWGWNKSNVSSLVFPTVTLPNVGKDTQTIISCTRYMLTELDTVSPPASLYLFFSLDFLDSTSSGSFAVIVFQDTLSPLSYLSSFSPFTTAIPRLSSEEITSFCIQSNLST